jgi:P-type Ca2+ transporter type 2C
MISGATTPVVAWHIVSPSEALSQLGSNPEGLSQDEAAQRLARVGLNRLAPAAPTSAGQIFRAQLRSIVVWLLIAAMVLSLTLGDLPEAAAIGAVLVLNTTLGFTIDLRARRAMDALLGLDVSKCSVIRGGVTAIVEAEGLVPGDVIEVGRGQSVPADARLLTTHDLRVSEAALTGESLPVSKHATTALDGGTPLAERVTMIYKGTTIMAGRARAVIAATGDRTELGRIGTLVAGIAEAQTPLERRLDELGRRLVWLVLAMAAAASGLNLLHGAPLRLVLEMGIALAVAAVPEALPAVATIALAIGLRRMAARRALVRRLAAVEALGSVTVVCSDKTRTLTSGDMTLVTVWTPDAVLELTGHDRASLDTSSAEALRIAVRSSRPPAADVDDANAIDDPVDRALVHGAGRAGIDPATELAAHPAMAVVPFSSERRLAACFSLDGDAVMASVKGAPGRILDLCDHVRRNGLVEPLDEHHRLELVEVNQRLASGGLRVLGVAAGRVEEPSESCLRGLTFAGFLGLMDPPADGVQATIARMRAAGMRTIMLTGDQRNTAAAVGRQLGIVADSSAVIDGRELQGLSASDLRSRLAAAGAFSRIAPEDKLRVVRALQEQGEVVAMLGDGVNDAAALKQADVGVAMGRRGTDVAKEAAAIVLQDDRFETIAAAVEEGRVVYDNIRKFVFYLFSCNLAEVLVLSVAGLAALPPPLLPLQILWLNLVTDTFPALALALEPADHDVMRRPPRDPREALLSASFIGSVVFYAALITVSATAAFVWALSRAPEQATTVCFMTLGLAQIFHLGNARSPHHVLHPAKAFANRSAVLAVALAAGLQWASVAVPGIARLIGVTPLDANAWVVVIALSAVPATAGQVVKRWRATKAVAVTAGERAA